jgi:hypothetical protein
MALKAQDARATSIIEGAGPTLEMKAPETLIAPIAFYDPSEKWTLLLMVANDGVTQG